MRPHIFLYRAGVTLVVALTCVLLLAALVIGWKLDSNACDLQIPIGVSSWSYESSWWPLGQTCIYWPNDASPPISVPPGYTLTVTMAAALVCGVLLVWLLRRWHERHIARWHIIEEENVV